MKVRNGNTKLGLLGKFLHCAKGSVSMIAGFSAIPMLVAAGVAVDMARASHEQQAFQAAMDAAALAVGASEKSRIEGLTDAQRGGRYDELKQLARKYINENYQPTFNDDSQISIAIDIPKDGTVVLDGRHDFPTTIMSLVGIDELEIAAKTQVERRKIPNPAIEIALVLDTTLSMEIPSSKLANAKLAAKDLLDIVYDGKTTSPFIKVALVPFAQAVNVGADKKNSGWIDKDGLAEYSKQNFYDPTWHNMKAWEALGNRPWTGCVEARKGALDTDDTPPSTGSPNTLFTPWFAPDEPNTGFDSRYSNNWVTTEAAETLGLTSAQKNSADRRQRNQAKYNGQAPSTSGAKGPWYGCKGTAQIIPLTNVKSTIVNGIDALTAAGFTHVNIGTVWGWRVLSPTVPYTEGVAYSDKKWKKIMIVMTDGDNTYPPYSDGVYYSDSYQTHDKSDYSSYGHLALNRLGTTSISSAPTKLDERLATVCTNAKAAGIEVWTVAFDVTSPTINNLLRGCATDPEKYLTAPDGATLRHQFQAIGENILESRLYISK